MDFILSTNPPNPKTSFRLGDWMYVFLFYFILLFIFIPSCPSPKCAAHNFGYIYILNILSQFLKKQCLVVTCHVLDVVLIVVLLIILFSLLLVVLLLSVVKFKIYLQTLSIHVSCFGHSTNLFLINLKFVHLLS